MTAQDRTFRSLSDAMAKTPLLESVKRGPIQDLAMQGRIRQYRRGTYLFFQGDEAPDVYFLWQGRVEVSTLSVTGRRQLHTILDTPQFLGELGVLSDLVRTATAVALDDATAWVCSGDVFLAFLTEHPEATLGLVRALARQIQAHEAFVEDLLFLDLKGRVAKRLLGLVSSSLDEVPPDGSVVPSLITHSDLANLAGGSRENVTRILSEFQRRGLVVKEGRRYILKNVAGLRRLAGL